MNQRQSDHFTRDESLLMTLNNSHAIWTANPVFAAAVNAYQTKVNGINALQVGQISGSKGITLNKTQTRDNLILLTLAHADAGRAYAISVNNTQLAQNLKLSKSSFRLLTDAQIAPTCQNVYNLVSPIVANLGGYGVNAASLSALQAGINTYAGLVGAPQSAMASASAYTSSLVLQLASIDTFIAQQLDPLMTQYRISQPIFYEAYFATRKVRTYGTRTKVIVDIVVTKAGVAAENAVVKMVVNGKTRKKVTDVGGAVSYHITPPVNNTVTVELTGFANQTKAVNAATAQTVNVVFAFGSSGGGGTTNNNNTTPAPASA